jgi:hypothetical protein
MTLARACAIKSCDFVMPIRGSRDVQHDDESHHDAPFVNQARHGASCDVFYESCHEGARRARMIKVFAFQGMKKQR